MNEVASLDLCKELYELSEWETDHWYNNGNKGESRIIYRSGELIDCVKNTLIYFNPKEDDIPAYSLGYLLRKLDSIIFSLTHLPNYEWRAANDNDFGLYGDTPEDAVCKLSIELFKQGLLK